jgi:hypothetical protein
MVSLLFEHNRDSNFKLEKGHAGVACDDCHEREEAAFPSGKGEAIRYLPISDTCLTCHEDQHAGQLSSDCQQCHTLDHFTPAARFDHANSRFPLVGKHPSVECRNCHRTAVSAVAEAGHETTVYRPLERECLSCHGNPHQGVLTDNCVRCHTTSSFSVERFDHSRTSFELTGRHSHVQCDRCHPEVLWRGKRILTLLEIESGCMNCHRSPHRESHNDCERCHSTSDWKIYDW